MKYAHLADCHIGAWRDSKLRDANTLAFIKTVDSCIDKDVDFILISGDLFNTPLPALDNLKVVVNKLKKLKDNNIPVYVTAGSHDFSPSGKTMLDVLEEAGLMKNVVKGEVVDNKLRLKFTIDKKTGAKITGMLGKKGSLEKSYYESLYKEDLEKEEGYKIFMFHSALTEFKTEDLKDIESQPLSLLPKNFSYYAGGHVHYVFEKEEVGYGLITFPGPVFPNNFSELEKLERGGFYILNVENDYTKAEWQPIQVYNVEKIKVDCNNMTPEQVENELMTRIKGREYNNTIVLIRLYGILSSGKVSDINFKDIYEELNDKSAYFVMRNVSKLKSKEFEEIKVDVKSVEDVEEKIIKEHLGQIKVNNMKEPELKLTTYLMRTLSQEKSDLTKFDFENKLKEEINKILEIK